MATNPFISDMINFHVKELGAGARKNIEALHRYGCSQEPNETGVQILFDTKKPIWEITKYAAGCMQIALQDDSFGLHHVIRLFDWKSIDSPGSIAVDVGGGIGHVSQYVANLTDHLSFIVQDLPHIATQGAEACPDALKSRVQFQAHDFFTPQTLANPPALFFMKFILHDWSDKYATMILKGLVPSMDSRTKLVIFDAVLPEGPVRRASRRFSVEQDITMHIVGNGRERSESDFRNLLAAADKRFVLEKVNQSDASRLSATVVGWKSDA